MKKTAACVADQSMNVVSRTTSRNGFTTIEILIVVVILAITAAVAIPMVGNRSDLKVTAAARKLVADLQYAQSFAIATRQNIYIRFEADKYTVCTKPATTLIAMTHPVDRGNFVVTLGAMPSASALAAVNLAQPNFGGNHVLAFDSVGAPFSFNETNSTRANLSAAAQITLTCGSASQVVRVEPYTGEISAP